MFILGREGTTTGAVLSLGSNEGEREWNVLAGAASIEALSTTSGCALSSLYISDPVGAGYSRRFVNAAMILRTGMDPFALLAACHEIESRAGRMGDRAGDRTLDIDIVLFGREDISTPELELPHPEFRKRLFVLLPLAELVPRLELPPDRSTAREAADLLVGRQEVSRISSRKVAADGARGA